MVVEDVMIFGRPLSNGDVVESSELRYREFDVRKYIHRSFQDEPA